MMRISWAIFLCAFFLLRPFSMQGYGLLYPDDDFDFFANSTSLAFGQFPSYKNEFLFRGPPSPQGAIGTGIMAAPFVFAFSWIDRLNHSDIAQHRTGQNILSSWTLFGFIFASGFYFCVACFLLYRALELLVGPSLALWAVILMTICQGMPLYAYRRPVFSHAAEFFLQSVFVYAFINNEMSGGKWMKKWWSFVLLGIGAGMISLTRYNNVFFTLVWPFLFLSRDIWQKRNWGTVARNLFCVFAPAALLVLIFKSWPEAHNHYVVYQHNNVAGKVFELHGPWQEFVRRFWHVLFAPDWGLIFTAPFLLLGIWGLALLDVPWKKKYWVATLPLLVNFYVINVTGCQGAYYGYRYLIGSALPLLVLPLAFLLKWFDRKAGFWWKWGVVLLALLPLMSMWCYEGSALVATSPVPTSFFGVVDWGNNTYQIGVWQAVLNFKEFLQVIYLGGVQYFWYLFYKVLVFLKVPISYSLNNQDLLFQTQILNLTVPFELKTFIQVLLIYSAPFLTGWFLRKRDWSSPKK